MTPQVARQRDSSVTAACLTVAGIAGVLATRPGGRLALLAMTAVTLALLAARTRYRSAVAVDVEMSRPATPSTLTAAVLAYAVVALDWSGFLRSGSNLRFLFVALLVAVVLRPGQQVQLRMGDAANWALLLLVSYALVGSIVGRFYLGTAAAAVGIALPLIPGLFVSAEPLTEVASARVTRHLTYAATLYSVLNAIAASGAFTLLSAGEGGNYRHEKAFIVVAAIVGSLLLRNRPLLILNAAAAGFAYYEYPAGTYLAAALVGGVTVAAFSTRRSIRGIGRLVLAVLPAAAACLMIYAQSASRLAQQYFIAVGKGNNTDTRLLAWRLAVDQIHHSPLWGSLFTGSVSLALPRQALGSRLVAIEAHDDYLTVWMLGGLAALALLVWWIIATNRLAARAHRDCVRRGDAMRARLLTQLIVAFNCFFAVSLFNPLLTQLGTVACLASTYAAIRTAARGSHEAAAHELVDAP
jgi:hypothetical protein